MRTFLILPFLVMIVYSCSENRESSLDKGKKKFDLSEAKAIIGEKTRRFTEAHITKDTFYLNNIFTKDARVLAPNSKAVVGKKAIAQVNFDWVNYGIHEFKEESQQFYGNNEFLIDEGDYFYKYGEENVIDSGKYINIWKFVDGDWKIYSNIWNTSVPIQDSE